MDRSTFNRGMFMITEAHQRKSTPEMLEVYWRTLSDLPDAAFMTAVERVLKTERFWPAPSVVRDHAAGSVAADDGSEVVALVERGFREVGAYRSVDFGDPAVNAAVRIMGGWPKLCALDVDEWQSFRSKDLVRHALHFRRFGAPADARGPVAGLSELSAANLGVEPEPPVRLGPGSNLLGDGKQMARTAESPPDPAARATPSGRNDLPDTSGACPPPPDVKALISQIASGKRMPGGKE